MHDKSKMYGLAIGCPFENECADCPLQEVRNLKDFERQIEVIDNMNVNEISSIVLFHNQRRLEREKHIWDNCKPIAKND